MTAYRGSTVHRPRSRRPRWLLPLLIAVAVLVAGAVGYAVVSLVRVDDVGAPATEAGAGSASACVTTMVPASELLPEASNVRVNVFNATKTSGLASETAMELSARDFKVMRVANDPRDKKIKGVAELRYGPRGETGALLILLHVPGAKLIDDGRKGPRVDLVLGETYDALAPVQGVEAQLAELRPSTSGPGCEPGPLATDAAPPSDQPSDEPSDQPSDQPSDEPSDQPD